MLLIDRISLATQALHDNRLRTLLSIMGITIGIVAVIVVTTISKGGSDKIFAELETFGLQSFWVFRDYKDKDPNRRIRKGSGITSQDYQLLLEHCCAEVKQVSPVVQRHSNGIIQVGNHYSNADVMGVGYDFLSIANDHLIQGRAFRKQDINGRRGVAIIGTKVVEDLFTSNGSWTGKQIIGKTIRVDGRSLMVIGVLKEKSQEFLSSITGGLGEPNNRILVPYTYLQKQQGNKAISYLRFKASSIDKADLASKNVMRFLTHLHDESYHYKAETMATHSKTAKNILNSVSLIGIIAASVSLLVGGMGIMNMMGTAVLERTREIGLRKAIGATQRDILLQFLLEAVFISMIGGLLGLLLGWGISFVLAQVVGFPLIPVINSMILALLVSTLVGIASGYFPAKKAALKPPVEALRYE